MKDTNRCEAESTARHVHYGSTHTVRCQLDEGHEGLHTWKDDAGRTKLWGGEPRKAQQSTRFRFGSWVQS